MKERWSSNDIVVYTDSSRAESKTSFTATCINPHKWTTMTSISRNLTSGKMIAAAETYVIYQGKLKDMDYPGNLTWQQIDHGRRILILIQSDSHTARDTVVKVKCKGPLLYLNSVREHVERQEM